MTFTTYVSKPVAISAMRYDGSTPRIDNAHMRFVGKPCGCDGEDCHETLEVKTISGQWVAVRVGDYIIKERHGDGYYPCHPAHFDERYMLVPSEEAAQ